MKCSDARSFLSEISEKSITTQITWTDLDFLSTSGYVSRTSKADYDQAAAEVANLDQINQRLGQEKAQECAADSAAVEDKKKFLSFLYPLHGSEYKESVRQNLEADSERLSKDEVPISADEARVSNYIQKKSALDQLVPYGDEYLSLTSAGVILVNSLNAKISRVSDMEFSDFAQQEKETYAELRRIAQGASIYVAEFRNRIFFNATDETGEDRQ